MKTKLLELLKKGAGLLLAFCVLAVSLFTSNIGVNIEVSAAVTVTDTWDGTQVAPTETDSKGNIIINTAEEMAWVALSTGGKNNANYIVKANSVFNMNGKTGVTLDSTAAEVKAATPTGKYWVSNGSTFTGNFDGNGVIIYNLSTQDGSDVGYAALFPYVNNEAATPVFSNITVKASCFIGYHAAAGIVGGANGTNNVGTLTFNNCMVENCYMSDNGSTNSNCNRTSGALAGTIGHNGATISNCMAVGNSFVSTDIAGGFIGNTSAYGLPVSISNSITIGTMPYSTLTDGSTKTVNPKASTSIKFTNVYTDCTINSSYTGVTTLATSDMQGTDVATKLSGLDFNLTWFANTSYPELRISHNIVGTNNGDGTHQEVCADCGLVGTTVSHSYTQPDFDNNITACICGDYIDGVFDMWDAEGAKADGYAAGTGTEEDPYIIKTVEQLYAMVRSSGLDEKGNSLYYRVADGVDSLYINDTRSMSQSDFEAAAAAGALKNWSTGLTLDYKYCGCGSYHKGAYIDYFGGKFDGNGVTIYGLYSKTTDGAYWAPGTGFIPSFTGDTVIKNVVFDTCYIENKGGFVGVITASSGAYEAQYTSTMCDVLDSHLKRPASANLAVISTVVRNSYLATTAAALDSNTYSYVGGLVSACLSPNSVKFINCLYDGTNSTVKTAATDSSRNAGIYSTRQGYNSQSVVESCLAVNCASTSMDVVYAQRWDVTTTDLSLNSYAYGSTAANTSLGTLKADGYTSASMLPLLNWTAWDINAVDSFGTPMPKKANGWQALGFRYYKDEFKNSEYYVNPEGATPVNTGYEQGVFSDFNELMGAGTNADPYIIDNAQLLFEIIASGGTNRGIPQYFKLSCDLDLGGLQWVNYQTSADRNDSYNKIYYQYKPFAGTIDGDGHIITGMFTASTDANAAFIPELAATGIVKNLHFSNSYAYSTGNYGIIVGTAESGSQIIGCSVVDCENAKLVGSGTVTIKDSFIAADNTRTYYLSDGSVGTPTIDGIVWYKGGRDESQPQLVGKADAMPCADVDGDGKGYEYTVNDLVSLKSKLLRKSAYANVYGDVSRNGIINIRDLVIMQREIAQDDIEILDGFWKNVKTGNFSIYYDEDDNYDFARKMELYLEEVTGIDITKTKGTTDENLTIRIVTDKTLNANNYSVTYDLYSGVLAINGGSFTAVEQGVLSFIAGSDAVTGAVYTGTGTIDTYKQAVTVNGQTYHYVWGDEFNEAVNGTVSYDKWLLRNKNTDSTPNTNDSNFEGIRPATDAEAPEINVVSDGKLTLKRGILSSADSQGYTTYASGISTAASMLYKRGYAEMLATLPSDGYAFPAWWLLTHHNGYNNLSVDRSLYSKVYELNENYNGTSINYNPTDYTTYQYKLPTQTLEIDIFEIIQKPTFSFSWGSLSSAVKPSTKYDIYFNIHKWYSASVYKTDTSLTVYKLDWDNVVNNNGFTTKLLEATGSSGENYTVDNSSILINENNLATGQVNGAITYEGGYSNTSGQTNAMAVNMSSYRSNGQVKQLKYGLLWTEDEMTFSIYDGTTKVYSATVTLDDLNFQNGEEFTTDQYAYMLIENHWYSAAQSGSNYYTAKINACDMVIDYVRLYQLDGARDIVTPETEREDVLTVR